MSNYVDGFVFPVPRDRLDSYRRLAEAVAEIWREYGALDYREFVGEDLSPDGPRSFVDVLGATGADAIVFGWVEFESRQARDEANARVAVDPRIPELVEETGTGFDLTRMAYGGFASLV